MEEIPEYVTLLNRDPDKIFQAKHVRDGRPFRVKPGGTQVIPWDTACFIAGDPFVRDISPREPWRTQQLQRLKVYYGVSMIGDDTVAEHFPDIEILGEDNEPIPMILHDPLGERIPSREAADPTQDALLARIARMEKDQAYLRELLAQRNGDELPPQSPADVARDGASAGDDLLPPTHATIPEPTTEPVGVDGPDRNRNRNRTRERSR